MRSEIVAAAVEELRIWGFERFSAEAVEGRAAQTPGVVRELWSSTEQLVLDALGELCSLHVRVPDTGSLRSDLANVLASFAHYFNTDVGRSLLRAAVIEPDQWAPSNLRNNLWHTTGKALRTIFERAECRNEIEPGVDHNTALQLATGPLFLRALYSNDAIDTAQCTEIADLVWRAVHRQEAPPVGG